MFRKPTLKMSLQQLGLQVLDDEALKAVMISKDEAGGHRHHAGGGDRGVAQGQVWPNRSAVTHPDTSLFRARAPE
jgi:hypothetical protein